MRLTIRFVFAISFTALLFSCATFPLARNIGPTEALTSVMKEYVTSHGFPGLTASLIRGGELVTQKAAGVRKAGSPGPLGIDDRMHLGSNTKAITGFVAFTLVAEGKISWTSTVEGVLKGKVPFRPEYATVTLEELFAHRSGLPANIPDEDMARMHDNEQHEIDRTGLAPCHAFLREERIEYARIALGLGPGSFRGFSSYSNAGVVVAGLMLETVSGQAWEDLVEQRIFGPLAIRTGGPGRR